jgi:hypothetical protein
MSVYRERILPHLIHFAMRKRELAVYRARLLSRAKGRVLEIGIGSGLNLPFYTPAVDELLGLEPSARLADMAQDAAANSALRSPSCAAAPNGFPSTVTSSIPSSQPGRSAALMMLHKAWPRSAVS